VELAVPVAIVVSATVIAPRGSFLARPVVRMLWFSTPGTFPVVLYPTSRFSAPSMAVVASQRLRPCSLSAIVPCWRRQG
jgi:hypothetical protein